MNMLQKYDNFYLVGIKGVAMTSIAQCLLDMGKQVKGSDVQEDFVTENILLATKIQIDYSFDTLLPAHTDCVIYTSAHQGPLNPQVLQSQKNNIATFSQAEALGFLFNEKKGIAVCGVGGKSTTSAMITWILHKTGYNPSYSVGVGNIPGLDKTGSWSENSEYFVAEADEYVIDTNAKAEGKAITPRFSFLQPFITVCTNLAFDHPDVYTDFNHTKEVYSQFFLQLKEGGTFVFNELNRQILPEFVKEKGISFGTTDNATFQYTYLPAQSSEGKTVATIKTTIHHTSYTLTLCIPGEFNIANAVAAVAATTIIGVDINQAIDALKDFHSTMRRFEYIGDKDGVKYYDDYAHHPSEIKAAIKALSDWYPHQRKIIVFQSHTYSRTKQLFDDFVEALITADEVYLIDIFASAREAYDPTISSDMLVAAVQHKNPDVKIQNVKTIENVAQTLKHTVQAGDVVLTLGAGDIYKVHHEL